MSLSYLIKFANYCDIKYKIKKLADLDPAAEPEIDLGAGPEVEDRAILNKGSLLMTRLFDEYSRNIIESYPYTKVMFSVSKKDFDKLIVNLLDFFRRNTWNSEHLNPEFNSLSEMLDTLKEAADERITELGWKEGQIYKIDKLDGKRGDKPTPKERRILIDLLKKVKEFCVEAKEKARDSEGFSRQTSFEKEVARSKRVDPDAISLDYLGTELDEFEDSPIREIWLGDEEDRFPRSK